MHAPDMPVQILLPLAPVTAERTTEMHFVAMTEQMPFECAFLRELHSTSLARIRVLTAVFLPYVQIEGACRFKAGAAVFANNRSDALVSQHMSLHV